MQEITLDPRIKKAGDLADEGFKELKKYQDGNNKTYLMCCSLQIRVLEFFESVENWINENN